MDTPLLLFKVDLILQFSSWKTDFSAKNFEFKFYEFSNEFFNANMIREFIILFWISFIREQEEKCCIGTYMVYWENFVKVRWGFIVPPMISISFMAWHLLRIDFLWRILISWETQLIPSNLEKYTLVSMLTDK